MMRAEIGEQPDVFRGALEKNRAPLAQIATELRGTSFVYALIAARGTSDNAARYATDRAGAVTRMASRLPSS